MMGNARKFIDSTPYKDFPFDAQSMENAFLQMMEDGLCIVAEQDGMHLGGVGAVKSTIFFSLTTVAAERFWWVVPDDRAAGVGKALLKAIHEAAKKANCTCLQMISLADPKVDAIYKSLDFTETEHSFIKVL